MGTFAATAVGIIIGIIAAGLIIYLITLLTTRRCRREEEINEEKETNKKEKAAKKQRITKKQHGSIPDDTSYQKGLDVLTKECGDCNRVNGCKGCKSYVDRCPICMYPFDGDDKPITCPNCGQTLIWKAGLYKT